MQFRVIQVSRTINNTIANFAGLITTTGLTLLFSIFYFRILGSENFGLVSFCTTILLIGGLFVDLGIGRTVTRELARREHNPELAQEMRDALFTLQMVHFTLAFSCGLAIVVSSPWLATHWLNLEKTEIDVAVQAITLLGIVATLQLPRELCRAALAGMQRQVLSNLFTTSFSTLRGLATIAALLWISPTPRIFLIVQVIVSILETGTLLISVWLKMPKKERRPHFDTNFIKDIWLFAVGDGLAVLLSIGMTMGDRILLSRLLPLDLFGSYTLAILIAEVILRAATPFSSAYFPHFSDLIARNNRSQLSEEYHRLAIVVSAFLVPGGLVMAFFPIQILQLITGQPTIAASFAAVLAVRALGNVIYGLQYLPHCLQLAAGKSTPALYLNILNISIYLPGILYFTPIYGFLVPAILWFLIITLQMPPMIFVTHRVVLKGEAWIWIKDSGLKPALISLAVVSTSAYFAPATVSWFITLPWLLTTYFVASASVMLLSNRTRPIVLMLSQRLLERAAFSSDKNGAH